MLGIQSICDFSKLKEDFEWLSLSSWRGILARNLSIRLITGSSVFDRQVSTRLILTLGVCYVVIIKWGFPRIIMLPNPSVVDSGWVLLSWYLKIWDSTCLPQYRSTSTNPIGPLKLGSASGRVHGSKSFLIR